MREHPSEAKGIPNGFSGEWGIYDNIIWMSIGVPPTLRTVIIDQCRNAVGRDGRVTLPSTAAIVVQQGASDKELEDSFKSFHHILHRLCSLKKLANMLSIFATELDTQLKNLLDKASNNSLQPEIKGISDFARSWIKRPSRDISHVVAKIDQNLPEFIIDLLGPRRTTIIRDEQYQYESNFAANEGKFRLPSSATMVIAGAPRIEIEKFFHTLVHKLFGFNNLQLPVMSLQDGVKDLKKKLRNLSAIADVSLKPEIDKIRHRLVFWINRFSRSISRVTLNFSGDLRSFMVDLMNRTAIRPCDEQA